MLFPSGIVQTFNGGILSVSDTASGLTQSVTSGLEVDTDTGDPDTVSTPRYDIDLNWANGTIASVDYQTNTGSTGAMTSKTIETTLTYDTASAAIVGLAKSDPSTTPATAIPDISYTLSDPTTLDVGSSAAVITRDGTFASGSVTLRTTTPDGGYTLDAYVFNTGGLITSEAVTLCADGTTASPTATTSYTYSTATGRYSTGAPKSGKLTEIDYADGSWEQFGYDSTTGWLTSDLTPFKNSAASDPSHGNLITYSYSTTDGGGGEEPDTTMLAERPRKITQTTVGVVTGITFMVYCGDQVTTSYAQHPTDVASAGVLQSTTTLTGSSYSVVSGAMSYTESMTQAGGVTSTSTVQSWGNTVLSNFQSDVNPFGGLVSSSSHAIGQSDLSLVASGTGAPTTDAFGRLTSSTLTNGLTSSVAGYNWFGPTAATGPDNEQTTYTYTALGQVHTATALGVTTTYTYDAAGNTTSVTQSGGTGGSALTTTVSAAYDSLGRMTSYTDAMGTKTTYAYDDSAHTVTTTYNAGSTSTPAQTEVDSYYLDGALSSVAGTAVTPVSYDEGVSSNGDTWTASSIDGGTTWSKDFTNMLGQDYKQTTPTPANGTGTNGTATATTLFDLNGRPYQTTDFDGSVTTTTYDPTTGLPGKTTLVAGSTSSSSIGTSNGQDRVETYKYFNNSSADSDGNVYSGEIVTDISTSGNVVTVYEEANGGLISREIDNAVLDSNNHVTGGLITTTATSIGTGAGEATVLTTLPDGTQVQDNYSGDLLQSEDQLATNGSTITSQSFGYDALNRNTSSTDPVFGTSSWTLNLDGSVASATPPGESASTVNTQDPTTDTPTSVTRSDGGTQTQDVNLLGQVTSQSGAGITPATFGYDSGTGQLNDLKLYPSGSTSDTTGMEETKWGYDPATGALQSETFADNATGHADVLNYTYAGVNLASSSGQGVTTTLGYNTAGEQTGASSKDTTTNQTVADTTTQQDDQGNPLIVTGVTTDSTGKVTASATDSFTYANGNLTSENQQAVGTTVHYDYYGNNQTGSGASPGAIKDMKLMQGTAVTGETDYLYNATTGRLQNIVVNGTTFTVNYLSNSNVIQSIGTSAVSTTWNYYTSGSSTGSLSSITTTKASDSSADYSATYTYNTNSQISTATVAQVTPPPDGSTTPGSINYTMTYGYDDQDQLISAEGSGDASSYSYSYDGVGNRTDTSMGTPNSLNEYSNFTYNQRGDLTDDGTYVYTWDAADELVAVTAKDNSVKVTFAYDGEGRCIEKDVYTWEEDEDGEGDGGGEGESGAFSLSYTRKFVYDGTNLVAELDGNNHLVTGYTWGPNGLMSATDYTASTPVTYMVMLDSNGNVTGLANAATGQVAASYTYSPYGALLTATGPAAGVCNLRFGQGYCEGEIGLNYFKARFETWDGIWVKADPAGIAGGSNVFVYSNNNPVNESDASGLSPQYGPPSHYPSYVAYTQAMSLAAQGQDPRNSMSEGDLVRAKLYATYVGNTGSLDVGKVGALGLPNSAIPSDSATAGAMLTAIDNNPGVLTRMHESGVARRYLSGAIDLPQLGASEAVHYDAMRDGAYQWSLHVGRLADKPSALYSAAPIFGSRANAIWEFSEGNYWFGAFYTVMAVSDVFLVKSIVTGLGKLAAKSLLEAGGETLVAGARSTTGIAVEEAAQAVAPIARARGILRVEALRAQNGVSTSKNIAYAEVKLTGAEGEFAAVSGETARAGFVAPPKFRIFTAVEANGYFRAYDSEAILLESIGQTLGPDSFGTIRLFSERQICESCDGIIAQFRNKFPKITLIVSHGP